MSMFAGYAQQAAALPTRPRGLFGGRPSISMGDVANFIVGGPRYVGEVRDRERQAARAQTEQQWRRARAGSLFQGDPLAQDLYASGNEEFLNSLGGRYRDEVLAQGSVRSRGTAGGAENVAAAPVITRFDDRYGAYDPLSGSTTFSQPRGMTEAEITTRELGLGNLDVARQDAATRRITAERPQIATAGAGVEVYGVGADGQTSQLAANTQARPMSDADQTAIGNAEVQIEALNTSLTRAQEISRQIQAGELNLGLVENLVSGGRNLLGVSDQNSLNYDALLNWAKDARNAVLQSNTGVQTDQDAIRELDTILSGTRDERIVAAALQRFQEARRATRDVFQRDIERRLGQGQPQASPQQQGGQVSREAAIAELRRRGLL